MNRANSLFGKAPAAFLALGLVAAPANAQISPDATLPNNSVVLPNGNVLTIEGGTEAGSNLFHSFEEFSIPTRSEAFFNNALTIDNIITRVTGGNLSDIDGLIRANGTANLFLINPNGIQFGPNASLDLGGSLFATTAESIVFDNGLEFSATEPNSTPLLTVNVPIGVQMGKAPGNITVRGNGHSRIRPTAVASSFDRRTSTRGLEVPGGRSIGLVGGNIFFESGVLTAEGGRIEIGAVGENGEATIGLTSTTTGWQLGYDEITNFGDIQLDERSLVDTSGVGSGSIRLQGNSIDLLNASTVLIQNTGFQAAGNLEANATGTLTLSGNSLGGLGVSELISENLSPGRGANIIVNAQELIVRDGATVSAFGILGSMGSIDIRATERVEVSGVATGDPSFVSALATTNFGQTASPSGDVSVETARLEIFNGGALILSSFGVNRGGNITIDAAESVEISGTALGLFPSILGVVSVTGPGGAGNLTVNAPRVRVTNGANIVSSTLDSGAAGDIAINATELVEVEGQFGSGSTGLPSQISSASDVSTSEIRQVLGLPPLPSGASGKTTINTPSLRVLNGGTISVRNDGTSGNAGSLQVNADTVLLENQGSLTALARDGRGGDIVLDAQTLNIRNNGQINASTQSGEGGNIELEVQQLQLRDGGFISTEAGGTGNGGNLTLDAETIALLEDSRINANAFEGSGGNVQITTSGLFASGDSEITASSQFGVDGTVAINNPIVDPASGLVALDGDTLDPDTQVRNSCAAAVGNRFVLTGNGGLPEDPTQPIQSRTVWRDTRLGEIQSQLTPNPTETETEESAVPTAPLVEATGWRINDRGQIELIVASGNPSQSSWQPHPECDTTTQATSHPALPEEK